MNFNHSHLHHLQELIPSVHNEDYGFVEARDAFKLTWTVSLEGLRLLDGEAMDNLPGALYQDS